jgi:hypothetical protein
MTSADRNDLMPAQEKLEWVTPKISLMDAGDTESKANNAPIEDTFINFYASPGGTGTGGAPS